MKKINLFLIVVSSIFIFACKTTNVASKSSNIKDVNGVWNLQDDGKTALGIGESPITLILDPTSMDVISGFAGCNNYGAKIDGDNGFIHFSDIYNTRMACPNLNVEKNYLSLLKEVNRFEVSRTDLFLYKNNLLLLHFKK